MIENTYIQDFKKNIESCSFSSGIQDGGYISMFDHTINLFENPNVKKNKLHTYLLELITMHELYHYYQLIGTTDGIYYLISESHWIDIFINDLKNNKNQIVQLPISTSKGEKFLKSKLEYMRKKANIDAFFKGNYSGFSNSSLYKQAVLEIPKLEEFAKYRIDGRFIYEGQAKMHEIIRVGLLKDKSIVSKLYNEIPFMLVYDWGLFLDIDPFTFIAIVDLALMRPFDINFNHKNIEDISSSLRFIRIYKYITMNKYYLKSIVNVIEYQNNICDAIGILKPRDAAESVLGHLSLFINTTSELQFKFKKNERYEACFDSDLITEEDLEKVIDKRVVNSFRIMKKRKNEDKECFKTIFSSLFLDDLIDKYIPPKLYVNGTEKTIKKSNDCSFDIGVKSHFLQKIINANELFNKGKVHCPMKKPNIPCDIDEACPGIFPNIKNKIPNCDYETWFKTTFRINLCNIHNS